MTTFLAHIRLSFHHQVLGSCPTPMGIWVSLPAFSCSLSPPVTKKISAAYVNVSRFDGRHLDAFGAC